MYSLVLDHPFRLLKGPVDNSVPVVATDLEGTLSAGAAWRGMHRYLQCNGRADEARRYYYHLLPRYMFRKILGLEMREFKNRSMVELLQYFEGYDREQFGRMAEWAVDHELWPKRRTAIIDELFEHILNGRRVIVVTGLFESYVEALLERLEGFEAIGTPLAFVDGKLDSGQLATFNVGLTKAEILKPFMIDGKIFSAYGDSVDDYYMLAASEFPVAVLPDKGLKKIAESSSWRIIAE